MVQLITLSLPAWVEVELGCDNLKLSWYFFSNAAAAYTHAAAAYACAAAAYAHAAAAYMRHCENKANSAQLELGLGLSLAKNNAVNSRHLVL